MLQHRLNHRLLTATARFRSQVSSLSNCGGKSGTGAGFFPTTSASLSNYYFTECATLIYHPLLVQCPNSDRSAKWTLTPPHD
jgi:hypothetical protein